MQGEVFIVGYGLTETDKQAAHYEALDLVSKVWRPGAVLSVVYVEGGITFRTEDGAEYVSVSQAWVKA